MNTDRG